MISNHVLEKERQKRFCMILVFLFNKIVNKRVSLSSIFLKCFVMEYWEMLAVYWVRTSMQQVPTLSSLPNPVVPSLSMLRLNDTSGSSPFLTDSPQAPSLQAPPITLINAAAFLKACQLDGSQQFSIQLKPDSSFRAALINAAPDLSSVPKAYHDFAVVFSKAKASVLAPHQEYDLKIEPEEGVPLLPGRLYSLSPVKLETL